MHVCEEDELPKYLFKAWALCLEDEEVKSNFCSSLQNFFIERAMAVGLGSILEPFDVSFHEAQSGNCNF